MEENTGSIEVMYVVKRNGEKETVSFDKVSNRLKKLIEMKNPPLEIDYIKLAQRVCGDIYPGVETTELDELAGQICACMITEHADYGELALRLAISNHHKKTSPSFSEVVESLMHSRNSMGEDVALLTDDFYKIVQDHKDKLNQVIDYERDYMIDYFGFKTLEKSYLLKSRGKIVERPQQLFMRVAIGIHGSDIKDVISCYHELSLKRCTHATPTLFNAGTRGGQLASCFLMGINDDSIHGIYDALKETALISKMAGGIGVHIHDIRARGSLIAGGMGVSNGIVPMLRVFNNTARYVDQCVVPETIIYTTDGPMEIQNVVGGETTIMNSNGDCEVISNVLEHPYDGDLYEIKTSNSYEKLKITEEHPIYVLSGGKMEWKDAKDVCVGDSLIYSVPNASTHASSHASSHVSKYNDDISIEDCFMYGVLLNCGTLKNVDTFGKIDLKNATKEACETCENYFEDRCIHRVYEDITCIIWKKTVNTIFRYGEVYNDKGDKRIHKKWLNLPEDKIRYILRGIFETSKTFSSFDTFSKELFFGVQYLLLRLGILCSELQYQDNVYTLKIEEKYFYNTFHSDDIKECENKRFVFSPITNITKSQYSGTLYDLQMKKTHDYMLHQGIVHNGGGKRNGSFAMYMEPWHADIFEFLDMKKNQGAEESRARDLFYALWISDLFMRRVESGGNWTLMCPHECPGLADVYGTEFEDLYEKYESEGRGRKTFPAQELWFKILESQIETGTPYMLYKDSCNYKSNQKNLGTIRSSNLCCVTPDTQILTKKGYYSIKELENQEIEVWNGKSWSKTTPMKTGENKKILTVKFSNNMELKCTEYHKFYIETGKRPYEKSVPIIVEAKDLKPDMRIIRYKLEIGEHSSKEMKYPYTSGMFAADGTYTKCDDSIKHRCKYKCVEDSNFCKRHMSNNTQRYFENDDFCKADSYEDRPILYLYDEKKMLDVNISFKRKTESNNRIVLELPMDIEDKYTVPINYSLNTKLRWLEGLVDGDGTMLDNDKIKNIQISSIHKEFLVEVLYLLQTLGILTTISISQDARVTRLPDGHGGHKDCNCKEIYRMNIDCISIIKLKSLGFSPKRLNINEHREPHHITNKYITIVEVEDDAEYSDTYCFNEPVEHKGVFNGILTGQCEILEFSGKHKNGDEETAVCNLASLSLPSFVVKPKDVYRVKMASKVGCTYCALAEAWCIRWEIPYVKVFDEKHDTYPQIFVDTATSQNVHVGGYIDFVKKHPAEYDYEALKTTTSTLTKNLNKVIDKTTYPIPGGESSNKKHRPIGLGVQGLADVFFKMRIPFDSPEAREINVKIFETIYYGAMCESLAISKKREAFVNDGRGDKEFPHKFIPDEIRRIQEGKKYVGAYSSFEGSPLSEGKFQFDLWEERHGKFWSDLMYDWDSLREEIMEHGVRNSLLLAPMPTASTAQILGNTECFEPITSNIYVRRTLAGEFIILNKYLQEDLSVLGMWNESMKNEILLYEGSIQPIETIPAYIRDIYKTVWDMSQKTIIDMAADRGRFICQSQSMNLFQSDPKFETLTSMYFYAWKQGLKTGLYYLRTKPKGKAQAFTIKPQQQQKSDGYEVCESCSG